MYIFFLAGEPKLRHVEKDILIPKLMKDKAKELCSEQVKGESEIQLYIKSKNLCDLNFNFLRFSFLARLPQ